MSEPRPAPSPPHPVLAAHYGAPERRYAFVRELFDRTAADYDRIARFASLGLGDWYRRRALVRAGLRPGMRMLDVATGTGLLARQAVAVTGGGRWVTGLDISAGMLAEARRNGRTKLVGGRAEALPFRGAAFDLVAMGYAIRHVDDLEATFAEFHRVLRPGGTALVLEIGAERGSRAGRLAGFYLSRVVPPLSQRIGRGKQAGVLMRYFWDTVRTCVPPATIVYAMRRAGFDEARCETEHGLFRAFLGRKPGSHGAP
jgi:demethylmenaquinone methyltransferase/2-methoxy-6-polyprenyl-1,4-benzoquinol methylase